MSILIERARKYVAAQPKSYTVLEAETGLAKNWLVELTKKRSEGRDFGATKIETLLVHAQANGWSFDEHNNPIKAPAEELIPESSIHNPKLHGDSSDGLGFPVV